jgi:hypothetical protein
MLSAGKKIITVLVVFAAPLRLMQQPQSAGAKTQQQQSPFNRRNRREEN